MAVTAGIALAGAGIGLIKSLKAHSQAKKDAEEVARLKKPFYAIQDEYYQNRNLAAGQAGQGFSSDTKNYLTTEARRGLGAGIGAVTSAGGGPNDISKLFSNYQNSIDSTAALDAQTHLQNIEYYKNANKDLAAQKTIQWGVNEKQPYEAKLKELTQRRAADAQNEQEGINTAFGSLTGGLTGMQNTSLLKKLFAQKTQTEDPFLPATKRAIAPPLAPVGNRGINTAASLPGIEQDDSGWDATNI